MKIYYVRHGQTDFNLTKKMQGGGTEKDLNETGIIQANKTSEILKNAKYDVIICSPMNRAKQTAEIINKDKNIPIIIDERMRERKLGKFEGYPVTPDMEKQIWDCNLNFDIPNGENLKEFKDRIFGFIEDLKQKYDDKSILVVAHGGIAKVLKAYYCKMPDSKNLSDIRMENCEILELNL